jgi:hypothetical protein
VRGRWLGEVHGECGIATSADAFAGVGAGIWHNVLDCGALGDLGTIPTEERAMPQLTAAPVPDGDAPPAPSASHTDAVASPCAVAGVGVRDHSHWATHDRSGVDPIKVGACRGHVAGRHPELRQRTGSRIGRSRRPSDFRCQIRGK